MTTHTFEAKYDKGDWVWILSINKWGNWVNRPGTVGDFRYEGIHREVYYRLFRSWQSESDLFPTREEAETETRRRN